MRAVCSPHTYHYCIEAIHIAVISSSMGKGEKKKGGKKKERDERRKRGIVVYLRER